MPKTTKRTASKRAARIARAHATELPELQIKPAPRKVPGYKPPARGVRRYPWAIILSLLVIVSFIGTLYAFKVGPFAPPPKAVKPKPTATKVATSTSPCLKISSQLTDTKAAPSTAEFAKIKHTYTAQPKMSIDTNKIYCVGINTNRGLVIVELDPKLAPNTVNNFVYLAQHQFYDGLKFHRVVPDFIIQTGDPKGDGTGGSGYKIAAEPVKATYVAGTLAMAKLGTDTLNSGSQFFITTTDDTAKLEKVYNLFGHVVKGMDVVTSIKGPGDDASTKNITPDVINHVVVMVAP